MKKIYKFANRVIAWLGSGTKTSKLVIESLNYLGRQFEVVTTGHGKYHILKIHQVSYFLAFFPFRSRVNFFVWVLLVGMGWVVRWENIGIPTVLIEVLLEMFWCFAMGMRRLPDADMRSR